MISDSPRGGTTHRWKCLNPQARRVRLKTLGFVADCVSHVACSFIQFGSGTALSCAGDGAATFSVVTSCV